jgi:hypothetical protein
LTPYFIFPAFRLLDSLAFFFQNIRPRLVIKNQAIPVHTFAFYPQHPIPTISLNGLPWLMNREGKV